MTRFLTLLALVFGLLLSGCSGRRAQMASAFDYHAQNKEAMLEAIYSLDGWLRQRGFEPAAEPKQNRVAGMPVGVSTPGMAEFWYRGASGGSEPFYVKITLLPSSTLHIMGDTFIETYGSETAFTALKRKAGDFAVDLSLFAASIPVK